MEKDSSIKNIYQIVTFSYLNYFLYGKNKIIHKHQTMSEMRHRELRHVKQDIVDDKRANRDKAK